MDQSQWIPTKTAGIEAFEQGVDSVMSWARSYLESLSTRDVAMDIAWGEVLDVIPESPPRDGIGADGIEGLVQIADREFVDRVVHWQSPRFFAYFPCSSSVPAMLGELMSSILNINGMLWSTSPACTELEMRMMDWGAQLFGLDDGFMFSRSEHGGGCIQGTASEGVVAAMVAARRRMTKRGIDRSRVTVYTSDQAHSSVVKAAMVCGLADDGDDRSRVRLIKSDRNLSMDADELKAAMEEDLKNGLVPALIVPSIGTTSTGAIDPIPAIMDVVDSCKVQAESDGLIRAWVHVDAAWAGAAMVCPEFRGMFAGVERADSLCINPHKWLLTNFDCDFFWVRDQRELVESMNISPAYLRDKAFEDGTGVVDYRDWHVALGRRMRALKVWMVFRCFGANGLMSHIRSHVEFAKRVEEWVHEEERVELVVDRCLGLVCFAVEGGVGDGCASTKGLVDWVNAQGRVMITHSRVPIGEDRALRSIVRVSVGTPGVEDSDIDVLLEELGAGLDQVCSCS